MECVPRGAARCEVIRVAAAPAPPDFDARVRRPGLDAIAELVGEKPSRRRRGPKRARVADRRDRIPPDAFPPLWREVLPDMCTAYGRICAYLSLYIELATGSPTVDHVIPKSKAWDRVYEWSNYRLACALVNAHKGVSEAVLDPFAIGDGWFALELVEYRLKPGDAATGDIETAVIETITQMGLNSDECCKAREAYASAYEAGEITLSYLVRRAPFVAHELRRQGRLRPEDREWALSQRRGRRTARLGRDRARSR
jgi:5-methylcytosine-specific restriction endonuclease McrA